MSGAGDHQGCSSPSHGGRRLIDPERIIKHSLGINEVHAMLA